jgi:hypothetical protein
MAVASPAQRRNVTGLVGRDLELATLRSLLSPDSSASVAYLHGIPGIGKSHLLAAFADAVKHDATVLGLDCRTVEPTERGFMTALAQLAAIPPTDDPNQLLSQMKRGTVLVLDNYETFRLMDTWLRQELVPRLGETHRLVVSGREPPVAAWLTAPELAGTVRAIALGPLGTDAALELLAALGLEGERAVTLSRVARGHPLALRLGSAALAGRPDLPIEEVAG